MSGPRWLTLTERDPEFPRDSDGSATTTGRRWLVRVHAIDAVTFGPARNAVDAAVYLRGHAKPILVCEQGDDILCDVGAFADRCRTCRRPMPGAGVYGHVCPPCQLRIAEAGL